MVEDSERIRGVGSQLEAAIRKKATLLVLERRGPPDGVPTLTLGIQVPSYPYSSQTFSVIDPERYRVRGPHIGHKLHLCEMVAEGLVSLDQIKSLVKDPKFICRTCGRAAADELHLCDPLPIEPAK